MIYFKVTLLRRRGCIPGLASGLPTYQCSISVSPFCFVFVLPVPGEYVAVYRSQREELLSQFGEKRKLIGWLQTERTAVVVGSDVGFAS